MPIQIASSNSGSNYPTSIDCSQTDLFTCQNFRDLYRMAQNKNLTDYVIGITEIEFIPKGSQKPLTAYHIYDGVALNNYLIRNPIALDPSTNCTIKKVHYFALKCFDLNLDGTINIVVEHDKLKFMPLEWADKTSNLLDAYNYNIEDKDLPVLRQLQYIIGDALCKNNNKAESLRWLMCSATNNPHAAAARRLKHELGVPVFNKLMIEMREKNSPSSNGL